MNNKLIFSVIAIFFSIITFAQGTDKNTIPNFEKYINVGIEPSGIDVQTKYEDEFRVIIWSDPLIKDYKYSNQIFDKLGYEFVKNNEGDDQQRSRVYRNCSKGIVVEVTEWYNIKLSISMQWYALSVRRSVGNLLYCDPETFETELEKKSRKEEEEKEFNEKMQKQNVMTQLRKNQETKVLAKYLEDNKIYVKPTVSGLYYIEEIKGQGANPTKGCVVMVNYTGRLLENGKIFDTNNEATAKQAGLFNEGRLYQPIEFSIGRGQVIPGWDEGVSLMSLGSKGQLIIPSSIGYGAQGGGEIPPFSTLVFDIELVNFTPAK
jgi:FKBP-type peptidyl-prolyl cis-trans isomerase